MLVVSRLLCGWSVGCVSLAFPCVLLKSWGCFLGWSRHASSNCNCSITVVSCCHADNHDGCDDDDSDDDDDDEDDDDGDDDDEDEDDGGDDGDGDGVGGIDDDDGDDDDDEDDEDDDEDGDDDDDNEDDDDEYYDDIEMITMSIRLCLQAWVRPRSGMMLFNVCSESISVLTMMLLPKQLKPEHFLMPRSNQGCGLLAALE